MGTRSITVINNQEGQEILVMYRQFDGYPSGHGAELANWLAGVRICNGIGPDQHAGKWANGMECLAAQMVAHFKDDIGGIYIFPAKTRDVGEEYVYTIDAGQGPQPCVMLRVEMADGPLLYSGVAALFDVDKAEAVQP